ncbi:MAG: tetratricopeptide repeat protein [Bacteroidota bacterium]
MSKKKDHFEQIDTYILGQMSDEQKNQFEEAMKNDIALKNEVSLRRDMMQGIKIDGRKKLKQTLEEIHHQKDRTTEKSIASRQRTLPTWLVAASIVLLLSVTFLWNSLKQPNLVKSYYQPYELSLNLRSDDSAEDLATIDKLYTEGDYSTVQPLIEAYLNKNPNQKTLQLALAICQFETKEYEKALNTLQSLESDPFLKDQARWYAALIYIDENNRSEAIKKLNPLVEDTKSDHHEEAKRLLGEIEKVEGR